MAISFEDWIPWFLRLRVWFKKERVMGYATDLSLTYFSNDGMGAGSSMWHRLFTGGLPRHLDGDKDNIVLLRPTGFKDSKRVDIYEGDLVDFSTLGRTHGPESETVRRAEVWWDAESGSWAFGRWTHAHCDEPFDHGYTVTGDMINIDSFRVVGNIHETT